MKCQKCAKQAVVHLTEIITEHQAPHGAMGEAGGTGPVKRTMEIHLCLGHAVEAGLVVPRPEIPPQVLSAQSPKGEKPIVAGDASAAIVPVKAGAGGGGTVSESSLALARDRASRGEGAICPTCGLNWAQFKQAGLMGCPHDFDHFSLRLLPLLKRAQEGATEHVGKIPPHRKNQETEKHVATLLLRRELQKAIHAEKYEEAATLRDQLRHLE